MTSWACIKLDQPGVGLVAFVDADISQPGEWACSRSDLVVDTARAVHVIEEELFSLKRAFPLP